MLHPCPQRDTMAHLIQTHRGSGAPGTSAVSDARAVFGVHCVLRCTIILLGSPLPFLQIMALALAGLAMTLLGVSRPHGGIGQILMVSSLPAPAITPQALERRPRFKQ